MSKRPKSRRQRAPQQRHLRVVPDHPTSSDEAQPLLKRLRQGLRSEDPVDLLGYVSGLLHVTDPQRQSLLHPADDRPHADRDDLIASLIGTPYAETTAALTVIHELIADDEARAVIAAELGQRTHSLPAWLRTLHMATVEPAVWRLTDALQDSDAYLLCVRLRGGHAMTFAVHVDNNMGGVTVDLIVVPDTLDAVLGPAEGAFDADGQTLRETDAADARARLVQATHLGLHVVPLRESNSWPTGRPMLEWALRMLPEGGSAPEAPTWTAEQRAALIENFVATPAGASYDDTAARALLDTLVWYGAGRTVTGTIRFSPPIVEDLLDDWLIRHEDAAPAQLARVPDMLRALVTYVHKCDGIPASATRRTLDAIKHTEPMFWTLTSGRDSSMLPEDAGGLDMDEFLLESYAFSVGGMDALMRLTDEPLPDEAFDWAGIPDAIHDVVADTLRRTDRAADELFGMRELRTAMRRLLAAAAANKPGVFTRQASPARAAAAIAVLVGRQNMLVGRGGAYTQGEVLAHFGVKGSVADRVRTFEGAVGLRDPNFDLGPAGDARYLASRERANIVAQRDLLLARMTAREYD